ncbi:MAG TPA: hypothetical protein VLN72_01890 [Gillisia sp.]|nr:hypothetical protein [Gillisia sp.]
MINNKILQPYLQWLPSICIFLFAIIYYYSSTLYPGGSQDDLNSPGFDWVHNYWSDLMNETGRNEQPNPAEPFAITAMVLMCVGLMIFFIQFAAKFSKHKFWRYLIQISGSLAMIFAILTFTPYHALMIALSSFFGLFVLVGIIREVYYSDMTLMKTGGVISVMLLIINNYIYFSRNFVEILPLLQKITFAFVLFWFIGLNVELVKRNRKPEVHLPPR